LIAEKYRLIERISEGGMGSVWKAHHGQLDAPVALKFMHSGLIGEQDARVRFEREAKAAARIRTPYIVHVYDYGFDEDSGAPFIVMELLVGEDLANRLRRSRTLQPERAVRICEQVCKGLYRAHDVGIVHRDLKPANIFLCEPDDDIVKILDFGIAKELGEQRLVHGDNTTVGVALGTPQYMSPEQARGLVLDSRSDLWSLAIVMFRAITGQRPFDGDDVGDIIVRICTEPVPSASSINEDLGPAVDRFFERSLDRNPDERFQSAKEFSAAFRTALLGTTASDDDVWDVATTAVARPSIPTSERSDSKETVPTSAGVHVWRRTRPNPRQRRWTTRRKLAICSGFVVAGALIVLIAGNPRDLTFRGIVRAVEGVVARVEHLVSGPDSSGEVSAPPAPAMSSGPEPGELTHQEKLAREAWQKTYKHIKMSEIAQAVESLPLLILLDPDAPATRRNTFLELAVRAFDRGGGISDRMATLMTTGMGEHGPDLLFDIIVTRGETNAARRARTLFDAKLRKRGSKDMQHAYAIRSAAKCLKKTFALRAKTDGGFRTLREINEQKGRCVKGQRCCLKGDKGVAAVEAAIQARTSTND
jgi:serine/threonine protein kinase